MNWGTIGFLLCDWALVSALLATAIFVQSIYTSANPEQKQPAIRIANLLFISHILSVIAMIAVLIGLLFSKNYSYHYVWSHASNELPAQYVLACLWEGQEGSFLIWMFWHALLGLVAFKTTPTGWREPVLAVVASVQAILSSMVLGISLSETVVLIILVLILLIGISYLFIQLRKPDNTINVWNATFISVVILALLGHLINRTTGFRAVLFQNPVYIIEVIFICSAIITAIAGIYYRRFSLGEMIVSGVLLGIAIVLVYVPTGSWQLGSSPFLLLRQAMPDAPVFSQDPNFVPLNGNGLNPLLQNYWMVIHPPTLFLGFAASLFPFAFAVAGLGMRNYEGWIKFALPWALFTALVLGVGIIMGGYWAYETLNFGGYWNWDPVENASLVPWLTGVAALHTMISYRYGKTRLRTAFLLTIVTFLLILYSTFLTRSGILGDTSVHSFTDLGLSGQLLLLLLGYVLVVSFLLAYRWPELPVSVSNVNRLGRDTFLALAAIVLVLAAIEIIFVTSIPVINKLLGLQLAPPPQIQYFYFRWNIWFGIAMAALSAIGQYFFWTKNEPQALSKAIFLPFFFAAIITLAIITLIAYAGWEFIFDTTLNAQMNTAYEKGFWGVAGYLGALLIKTTDEILIFCALFTVFANVDIIRRTSKALRTNILNIGGALAHIGFGLMLIGMLFSSGYESLISVNMKPQELGNAFPEESKNENVLLLRNRPTYVKEYEVIYRGTRQAQKPLTNITILQRDNHQIRFAFNDSTGERYVLDLPTEMFQQLNFQPVNAPATKNPDIDLLRVQKFIENNIRALRPQPINNRTLYQLDFISLADSTKQFTLYPEAELNERMGLLAHPARKIDLHQDLYLYVTSVPNNKKEGPRFKKYEEKRPLGDTIYTQRSRIVLERIAQVTDLPEYKNYVMVVRLWLKILLPDGRYFSAAPLFMINDKNEPENVGVYIDAIGMRFDFVGADPKAGKLLVEIQEEIESDDYITIRAVTKPWINLLWGGTIILAIGFIIALIRRVTATKK
jgi:cytochrome c-type biogenesis protein CcmF